ncbi:hypothetical protein LC653_31215 [Nostoc sp. CHAB 5784]|uniref:hypothetical protein n=1 Tax=Nostoc mirabile TaxID=2907820 RepID=UPI001E54EE16|nr:hypothetical protein [Nostoc mirabile]MCC5668212.1 hypothetical protein [Nostoc mirabile CHAB5784]
MTHEFYLVINYVIPGFNTKTNQVTDIHDYCYGLYDLLCHELKNSEQFIVARACLIKPGQKPNLP